MENQFSSPGFYFQWHFMNACNLRCSHCYQEREALVEMDYAAIDKVVVQIGKALKKWKLSGRVSVTGGEPFLRFDKLEYILNRLNDIDEITYCGVLTNGTCITENHLEKLKKYPKLREIQFSLDGANESVHDSIRGKGSFRKTVNAIKKAVRDNFSVSTMFTINSANFRQVAESIDLVQQLGATNAAFDRYIPNDRDDHLALTQEHVKSSYEAIANKKKSLSSREGKFHVRTCRPLWNLFDSNFGGVCPVGYSCLTIMHDGTLYPCRRLPIPIGNILSYGIFRPWYTSPVLWDLRKKEKYVKCGSCELSSSCSGCRAMAYACTDDMMETDPHCWR